jgi:hypothetical protein
VGCSESRHLAGPCTKLLACATSPCVWHAAPPPPLRTPQTGLCCPVPTARRTAWRPGLTVSAPLGQLQGRVRSALAGGPGGGPRAASCNQGILPSLRACRCRGCSHSPAASLQVGDLHPTAPPAGPARCNPATNKCPHSAVLLTSSPTSARYRRAQPDPVYQPIVYRAAMPPRTARANSAWAACALLAGRATMASRMLTRPTSIAAASAVAACPAAGVSAPASQGWPACPDPLAWRPAHPYPPTQYEGNACQMGSDCRSGECIERRCAEAKYCAGRFLYDAPVVGDIQMRTYGGFEADLVHNHKAIKCGQCVCQDCPVRVWLGTRDQCTCSPILVLPPALVVPCTPVEPAPGLSFAVTWPPQTSLLFRSTPSTSR